MTVDSEEQREVLIRLMRAVRLVGTVDELAPDINLVRTIIDTIKNAGLEQHNAKELNS